jgi:hypothetical protein
MGSYNWIVVTSACPSCKQVRELRCQTHVASSYDGDDTGRFHDREYRLSEEMSWWPPTDARFESWRTNDGPDPSSGEYVEEVCDATCGDCGAELSALISFVARRPVALLRIGLARDWPGTHSDFVRELTQGALVEWITSLRARIDELAEVVKRRFPGVEIRTFGGPIGSLTEFQGHDVGLEAILPTGCVALTVTAAYLNTAPRVFGDVSWDGSVEATTCDECMGSTEWPLASAANLAKIERNLPSLVDAFAAAIERGRPG